MTINPSRAVSVVRGDMFTWITQIAAMPASELYALGDELAAMLRHPATRCWSSWRESAGERLGAILCEHDRRWQAIGDHESNHDIADRLDAIWTACAP